MHMCEEHLVHLPHTCVFNQNTSWNQNNNWQVTQSQYLCFKSEEDVNKRSVFELDDGQFRPRVSLQRRHSAASAGCCFWQLLSSLFETMVGVAEMYKYLIFKVHMTKWKPAQSSDILKRACKTCRKSLTFLCHLCSLCVSVMNIFSTVYH